MTPLLSCGRRERRGTLQAQYVMMSPAVAAPPAYTQGEDHDPSGVGMAKAIMTEATARSTSTAACRGLARYSEPSRV